MPRNSKKPTRKKLVAKLDAIFSKYIRLSNTDHRGYCTCVTCGKDFHWKKIQAGHFQSRKHYSTRWEIDNVHPQCLSCNMYRSGEQYKYSLFLGSELSEQLYKKSRQLVKFTDVELIEMIEKYSSLVKKLE